MADTTTTPRSPDGLTGQQDDGVTAQAQEKAPQEKAQEVAGQAKEQAQQAAGQAKDQIRTQVDQRSTQAGEQIRRQASDIRSVSDSLREQGKDGPAKVAEQAADRIERVGSYLHESDADRILGDVEEFARKQPWAVMAGGLALGFFASRFLKASQSERYQQRYSSTPDQLPNRFDRPAGVTAPPATGTPRTTGDSIGTVTETERNRTGATGTF